MSDPKALLRSAMDAQGITDNDERAGIAAVCMGESALSPHSEASYAHTSNERIRSIFRSRCAGLSDEELDQAKADPQQWFELVYGGMLGNDQPGDGYRYRGRGLIQLTGKINYARYGKMVGVDLVANPDMANDPETAARITAAYIDDRYDGGGFEALMRCVGTTVGDVAERKRAYYQEYRASGEFNAGAAPVEPAQPEAPGAPTRPRELAPPVSDGTDADSADDDMPPTLRSGMSGDDVLDLQHRLIDLDIYCGEPDGKFGPKTFLGVAAFQRKARLHPDGIVGPQTWAALDDAEDQLDAPC